MKKLFTSFSVVLIIAFLLPFQPGLSSCKKETVTITVHDTITKRDTIIRRDTVIIDPANNPNVRLTTGLLAYYPFTGNAGDSSGNGNHGTLFNGAAIASDLKGNLSSALSLNGTNGVIVNDGGKLNPTDSMSLSFDVMIRAMGRQHFIARINFNTGYGGTYGIGTNVPGDQRIQFGTVKYGTNCNTYHLNSDIAGQIFGNILQPESWYSVVATYKSGVHKLFINGKLISQVTSATTRINYCPNANFLIGTWWNMDIAGLNGKMDNVRVYNRVLNQDEITALNNCH